jgi:hypothetical protein
MKEVNAVLSRHSKRRQGCFPSQFGGVRRRSEGLGRGFECSGTALQLPPADRQQGEPVHRCGLPQNMKRANRHHGGLYAAFRIP